MQPEHITEKAEPEKVRLSCAVPGRLWADLKKRSVDERRTLQSLIEEALEQYLVNRHAEGQAAWFNQSRSL